MFISKTYSSENLNDYKSGMKLRIQHSASHPHLMEAGQCLPGVSES